MKRLFLTTLALSLITLTGCQKEKEAEILQENNEKAELYSSVMDKYFAPSNGSVKGEIIIKITEEAEQSLQLAEFGNVRLNSVPTQMGKSLNSIRANKVRRLFPPAGKNEARSRAEGMHLWYVVSFDPEVEVSTALKAMDSLSEVVSVEYIPTIKQLSDNTSTLSTDNYFYRSENFPFNDPRLPNQWHYNNTKKVKGSVMGADINLFKAWEITKGTSNVIVCVVDGGIDITHPDLIDNLWVNTAEKNGTPGVDDDNNGYVDDIHGYCFVNKSPEITAENHGTHVAGTVAARNNNGLGVCGVAGGDHTIPNSGVRLMSAAIFVGKRNGASAEAIKYGADNGAVISQNSWGYTYESGIEETPPSMKAAIDYFNKYAGCTPGADTQAPDSPMKGGVVIFAAGNDNVEYNSQPAAYEGCIAVAAMGTNFEKASYSNYGYWVDISAPGGDQDRYYSDNTGVLSTTTASDNRYNYYQGTSMACPHVSGVAALVVSHFGTMGYTADKLRSQLLASTQPINIDETNPKYIGKLGVGYIDAYAAVTLVNKKIAPEKPKFITNSISSNVSFTTISMFWSVPSDKDDKQASQYRLYYSDTKLTKENYSTAGKNATGTKDGYISGAGKKAGEEVQFTIKKLKPDTEYYFALEAFDRWGLSSGPIFTSVKTKKNNPPIITNVPKEEEPITLLDIQGKVDYELLVTEPDNHKWTYTFIGEDVRGISHKQTEKGVYITIRPVLGEGNYNFKIVVTDELKASSEYTIPFRIINVKTPVLRMPIPSQLIGVKNEELTLNVVDYFEQNAFLPLSIKATANDGTIASSTASKDGKISLKGFKQGKTTINIEASNGYKSNHTTFDLIVVNDINEDVYSVWPIPIQNELNVWVNPKHKSAKLKLYNVNGEIVFEKSITPDALGIATVNMKKIAPGSYNLRIEAGQKPFVKTVLKR